MKQYEELTESEKRAACEKTAQMMQSPTFPYVLWFAEKMEAKLEQNRHKGDRAGWLKDDIDDLLERLREEVCELDTAICEAHGMIKDPERAAWAARTVAGEAADVANFALFIADWWNERARETVASNAALSGAKEKL